MLDTSRYLHIALNKIPTPRGAYIHFEEDRWQTRKSLRVRVAFLEFFKLLGLRFCSLNFVVVLIHNLLRGDILNSTLELFKYANKLYIPFLFILMILHNIPYDKYNVLIS